MPSLTLSPAKTIAHKTALKPYSPRLISSIGAEKPNAIISETIAPASP